jgi:hypothetical protein
MRSKACVHLSRFGRPVCRPTRRNWLVTTDLGKVTCGRCRPAALKQTWWQKGRRPVTRAERRAAGYGD